MATNLILRRDKGNELTHDEMDENWDWLDKRFWVTEGVPTVNDDTTQGFKINHIWVNILTASFFKCTDAGAGVAVWEKLQIVSPSPTAFLDLTDTPASYVVGKWLKVNATGDGLEFVDEPTGGGTNISDILPDKMTYDTFNDIDPVATSPWIDNRFENIGCSPSAPYYLAKYSVPEGDSFDPIHFQVRVYDSVTHALVTTVTNPFPTGDIYAFTGSVLQINATYYLVSFYDTVLAEEFYRVFKVSDHSFVRDFYHDGTNTGQVQISLQGTDVIILDRTKPVQTEIDVYDIVTGTLTGTISLPDVLTYPVIEYFRADETYIFTRQNDTRVVGLDIEARYRETVWDRTTLQQVVFRTFDFGLTEKNNNYALAHGYLYQRKETDYAFGIVPLDPTSFATLGKIDLIDASLGTDEYSFTDTHIINRRGDWFFVYKLNADKISGEYHSTTVSPKVPIVTWGMHSATGVLAITPKDNANTGNLDAQVVSIYSMKDVQYLYEGITAPATLYPPNPQIGSYFFNETSGLSEWWNGTAWVNAWYVGVQTFLELTDTPASYTGGLGLKVNDAGDGIEFYELLQQSYLDTLYYPVVNEFDLTGVPTYTELSPAVVGETLGGDVASNSTKYAVVEQSGVKVYTKAGALLYSLPLNTSHATIPTVIAMNETHIVIPMANQIYIYTLSDGVHVATGDLHADYETWARFGEAIDCDDTHILVSAPQSNGGIITPTTKMGVAFLYDFTGTLVRVVRPTTPVSYEYFGTYVSIDGDRYVCAGNKANTTNAYFFDTTTGNQLNILVKNNQNGDYHGLQLKGTYCVFGGRTWYISDRDGVAFTYTSGDLGINAGYGTNVVVEGEKIYFAQIGTDDLATWIKEYDITGGGTGVSLVGTYNNPSPSFNCYFGRYMDIRDSFLLLSSSGGGETFTLLKPLVARGNLTEGTKGTTRPATPIKGQYHFDDTLNKPIWYNGANWTDSAGTVV